MARGEFLSSGQFSPIFLVSPAESVDGRASGMEFSVERDCDSLELVVEFPLTPINDDHAYSRAIAVLDRLFTLGDQRTPAETEYFNSLAMLACEYEENGAWRR
jgi:hypothetical protein